jgi:hypothetical protein
MIHFWSRNEARGADSVRQDAPRLDEELLNMFAENASVMGLGQLKTRAEEGMRLDVPFQISRVVVLPGQKGWTKAGMATVEDEVGKAHRLVQAFVPKLRKTAAQGSAADLMDLAKMEVGVRLRSRLPHPQAEAWISIPLKEGVAQDREGPLKEKIVQQEQRAAARSYQMEGMMAQIAVDLLPTAAKVRAGSHGFVQVAALDNESRSSTPLAGANELFQQPDYPFLVDVLSDPTSRTTLETRICDRLNQQLKTRGWTSVDSVSVEIRPDPQAWKARQRSIVLRLSPMPERVFAPLRVS